MSISYSGIVNYGKVTLPSIESWGSNTNILRDPPKSITTRKIDKVGETTAITEYIDESGDRTSEAIKRYARGVNPMVSVAYNNHGTQSKQAFLPYRVARDGAFRPPILRQENLLPLSRMPRVWTSVLTQPFKPEYTRRIRNCGTAENTKEIRKQLLRANCEATKTIMTDPDINAPKIMGMIKDPLNPISIKSTKTSPTDAVESQKKTVSLLRNHPLAIGYTNSRKYLETPIVINNDKATKNRIIASGKTNKIMRGEGLPSSQSYNILADRLYRGGIEGKPSIPSIEINHPQKQLIRVR